MDADVIARALEILELGPNATLDEINQAYRDLAKVWHPDRFPNDSRVRRKAEERIKGINAAYETLQGYVSASRAHPRRPAPPPPIAVAPFTAAEAREHQERWAKHLGTTISTTNSIGMNLVLIPPGEFQMNNHPPRRVQMKTPPFLYLECWDEKRPQHKVRISQPYYLGRFQVTRGQYARFAIETKSMRKVFGIAQGDGHPAVFVSWEDSKRFCEWLSAKEGKKYRLPTEAEWEYACRSGTTTRYSFGDDETKMDDYAWFEANSKCTTDTVGTHTVGEKLANGFGLHDMHGNVWESCEDWHSADVWQGLALAIDPQGSTGGEARSERGGGWRDPAGGCGSESRDGGEPAKGYEDLGFRVLRVP